MDTNDPVIVEFIQRLDSGELNRHLTAELSKLSYDQLLRVGQRLAERAQGKKQ